MAKSDFINQLQALGYKPQELDNDFISFEYEIPVGKFIGTKVTLAFQVNNTFPMNAPGGPHFKPRLLPVTGGGGIHPFGAIHESPSLGKEWQYWSRPFKEWSNSERTVKTYLAHIKHLLATIK